ISKCYRSVAKVSKLVSIYFFFSSRRRHTRSKRDWSSDVCSSDLELLELLDIFEGQVPEEERESARARLLATLEDAQLRREKLAQIGRASCRERVEIAVEAGARKEKKEEQENSQEKQSRRADVIKG